jgi:AcrR family transcriptional regulator|tara:strand:+ start:1894 stop:2532 length:639 start_codon:yes stop_codon:yes gene_type:complete
MDIQSEKLDGRSLRAQRTYDEVHQKLVTAATDIYNNPLIKNNNITVSSIAKEAGFSVATGYNHFPDNKLDILGSIFKLGFEEVTLQYLTFIEKNSDPVEQLNEFVRLITEKIIELGDAVRYAFFNINEILQGGKWIQGEPYDILLNTSIKLAEQRPDIDPHKLAEETFSNFNGRIFLWMRFNPEFELWSKFTDEWLRKESKLLLDKALKLQK